MRGRWHRSHKQRKINQRISADARRKRQRRSARAKAVT